MQYSLLIPNKNECVLEGIKGIEKLIDDIFNSETNETIKEVAREEEINKYNTILEKVELIFASDNYDLTNIDRGEDQVINANKILTPKLS